MNRYSRQEILSEWGTEGQAKLANTCAVIIGCGGLGSIAAPYLAGAGVGRLILVDGDDIDESNLHRQVFFQTSDQRNKAVALAEHIRQLNPTLQIEVKPHFLAKSNIKDIIDDADIVLGCSDNIQCKYLLNDYCHLHNIPLVYGAIYRYEGYVSLFRNQNSEDIHLRDIFAKPDDSLPSCAEVGVFNIIAGLIGILQAGEALKYILGIGECLSGHWLTYDVRTNEQLKLKLQKTWQADISHCFKSTNYRDEGCDTDLELSWSSFLNEIHEYQLVSILEENEHKALSDDVLHIPLSIWSETTHMFNKTPVLYCMSGKRSMAQLLKLKKQNPDFVGYSLKGGLESWIKKYQFDN